MKSIITIITFCIIALSFGQDFGGRYYLSLPIQDRNGVEIDKNEIGSFYKLKEFGYSIFYKTELGKKKNWILINQISHSYRMEYVNNRFKVNPDLNNTGNKEVQKFRVNTSKAMLQFGITRKFELKKMGLEMQPKLFFTAKIVPEMFPYWEFSKGSLQLNYEGTTSFLRINPGIEIIKRFDTKWNVSLAVEMDMFDVLDYSSYEVFVSVIGNDIVQYGYLNQGALTVHNLQLNLSVGYRLNGD